MSPDRLMHDKADILVKILSHKAEEVEMRKRRLAPDKVRGLAQAVPAPRDFLGVLRRSADAGLPAIIAEIKKASPSKGVIRSDFAPADIAKSYAEAGASCLSVLTDKDFFQGCDAYIEQVKAVCELPVLRKDFLIDPYQIWESRAIGADCVLLIVAALTDDQLRKLADESTELGMAVLIEVHDLAELERALELGCPLIGVNNRNLRTFDTNLSTTLDLLSHIPKDRLVITESGIHSAEDVSLMRKNDVHGFLLGEACMRAPDPGGKVRELFFSNAEARTRKS